MFIAQSDLPKPLLLTASILFSIIALVIYGLIISTSHLNQGKRILLWPRLNKTNPYGQNSAARRIAHSCRRVVDAQTDEAETELRRLMTHAVKYWLCKRASPLAAEAMEVFGGNGYVEESVMPRLYREMPLKGIWEGSGNVMCLDVLRAISNSSPLVTTTENRQRYVRQCANITP